MNNKPSKLKRPIQPMSESIEKALKDNNVYSLYEERPYYQENDYLGWILRAKTESTKQKRIMQMIDELKDGHLYMKMPYKIKKTSTCQYINC